MLAAAADADSTARKWTGAPASRRFMQRTWHACMERACMERAWHGADMACMHGAGMVCMHEAGMACMHGAGMARMHGAGMAWHAEQALRSADSLERRAKASVHDTATCRAGHANAGSDPADAAGDRVRLSGRGAGRCGAASLAHVARRWLVWSPDWV
eukprot:354137-Chlamydomonas_euryale.AAC.3